MSAALSVLTLALVLGQQGTYAERILAEPSLVTYWRFEEDAGTTAYDSATLKDDNGQYVDAVKLGVPGAVSGSTDGGLAFQCVKGGQWMTAIFEQAFENFPTTVEFWIKQETVGDISPTRSFFRQVNANTGRHWYLGFNAGTASKLTMSFNPGGQPSVYTYLNGNTELALNQWHLVDAVLGTNVMKLYVDGALDAQVSFDEGPVRSADNIILGCVQTTATMDFDELAIYSAELSPEQIAAHVDTRTYPSEDKPDPGTPRPSPVSPLAFACGASDSGTPVGFCAVVLMVWLALRTRR